MNIHYHQKIFRPVHNSSQGEVDTATLFYYQQEGAIVTAFYQGGSIIQGQLIATADNHGHLDMRYQHLNHRYQLMTGRCRSTPEQLADGRLRLHESWEWIGGDFSSGTSVLEEVYPTELVNLRTKNTPIRQDRAKMYAYADGDAFGSQTAEEVFSTIFAQRTWNDKMTGGSVSGIGSSQEQTQHIRQLLPALLDSYNIGTLLDAPCGDFHWMQKLDWHARYYVGADIVAPLIAKNKASYENEHVTFRQLNILEEPLPEADLMLCRDCLVHFSYRDIRRVLDHLKASSIAYLLTTTFPEQTYHEDITTGGWRPINLQMPPFSFPPPLVTINEGCTEHAGAFRDKSLGLWKVSDLNLSDFVW